MCTVIRTSNSPLFIYPEFNCIVKNSPPSTAFLNWLHLVHIPVLLHCCPFDVTYTLCPNLPLPCRFNYHNSACFPRHQILATWPTNFILDLINLTTSAEGDQLRSFSVCNFPQITVISLSRYSDWLQAGRSGIKSRWGEIFRLPDRPWCPTSLLYNGYRVFPGGRKRPGRNADPSPPSSAEV